MTPWIVLIQALVISLAMTLALELTFSWMWGIRSGHDLKIVMLVNVLTNPVVVFVYYFVRLRRLPVNYGLVTILLEVSAVVTEALLYRKYSKTISDPWLFSISANSFSYAVGELINGLK